MRCPRPALLCPAGVTVTCSAPRSPTPISVGLPMIASSPEPYQPNACWSEGDLDDLRWHWDTAYVINYHPEAGLWTAERRDDHATLRAATADELLDTIRADYRARPVRREP